MASHHDLANFIWQIAELLRGPYRPPQYERVMLPMTVLRRFDCVLEPTKSEVVKRYKKLVASGGKPHAAMAKRLPCRSPARPSDSATSVPASTQRRKETDHEP
jgi:type I restriction-modification system DNA methylase subunit